MAANNDANKLWDKNRDYWASHYDFPFNLLDDDEWVEDVDEDSEIYQDIANAADAEDRLHKLSEEYVETVMVLNNTNSTLIYELGLAQRNIDNLKSCNQRLIENFTKLTKDYEELHADMVVSKNSVQHMPADVSSARLEEMYADLSEFVLELADFLGQKTKYAMMQTATPRVIEFLARIYQD